jgi:NDP-sugar pyrophosphorylase family protein
MAQGAPSYHTNADVIGLIMAGGRSQRMRLSFGSKHKSLVPILGVTLLERNICAFIARGITRIVVAVSEREVEVQDHVQHCATRLLASVGGSIECLKEVYQLGTIGAAGGLANEACESIAVANVDNLTTLDWNQMLAYHRRKGAAMTVAAHHQALRSPFGELTVAEGTVVRYDEKPVRPVFVSSGCYVLDSETCRFIAPGQRTDVPDLVKALLAGRRLVASYEHESAWIDINEAQSVADAERLVARRFTDFGCWHPSPHGEWIHLLVSRDNHVLATHEAHGDRAEWDLPGCVVDGDDLGASAAAAYGKLGFAGGSPRPLGSYDDFDEGGGSVIRRHLFLCHIEEPLRYSLAEGYKWIPMDIHADDSRVSEPMRRAINVLRSIR